MLEILVVILAHAAVVLGILVRILFLENARVRSDLESRLHAIENLKGPFVHKLALTGPAPLNRVLALNIYLDVRFWVETLQLTPLEIHELKTRIQLPDEPSKKTGVEDFDQMVSRQS
jgi:hypothetical protein